MKSIILGFIGTIWGGAVIIQNISQGINIGGGAYATGKIAALVFAGAMCLAGLYTLIKNSKVATFFSIATLIGIFVFLNTTISAGEIVRLPKKYKTQQQAEHFLRQILSKDFQSKLFKKFPTLKEQNKGGFRYQPVLMKSFKSNEKSLSIQVIVYGLDEWEQRGEFENYLLSYLKYKIKKI